MRRFLLLIPLLIMGLQSHATHWMGGEITWTCQGAGDYIFQLKIYRDCNGVAGPNAAQINVWGHPSITTIPMVLSSQTDISPTCNQVMGGPAPITCAAGGSGAVEEFVFVSAPFSLTGVPPVNGWHFTWHGFSRNGAIQNIQNPSSYGITLRATMYGFSGSNTNPCFDSSPQFAEVPATILCTGTPFRYNQNAYDPDLDSLAFSFGAPLNDITTGFDPGVDPIFLPYEANYSSSSPLPSTAHDPNNVPAVINPHTGEVSFTSFTQGNFVTVVKVESWRCGQKIAEVYRELQIVLLGCGVNTPPIITSPFPGNSFADTVYAGEVVNFTFTSSDPETLQDGSPQSNVLLPSGAQFGSNFSSTTTGCANPPCAVLSNAIPQTGVQGLSTDFSWQTDCSHVSNGSGCSESNTHTFVFKVSDDFCPAPGVSMPTISITVLALPPVGEPSLHCASVNPNGNVDLTWSPPVDTTNSFSYYEIWSSTSQAGPYTLVGTENNFSATSFTHVGVDAQLGSHYYYMKTVAGCTDNFISISSDTLKTMHLSVFNSNGVAQLNWNAISNPLPATSVPWFTVWMEYPAGTFTMLDSVPYGTTNYDHVISVCDEYLEFHIEMEDSTGCTSVSSLAGDFFSDVTPPQVPIINYVSVDTASGNVVITWDVNPDDDTGGYVIMQLINGQWIPIDTVYGINNTSYMDLISNPSGGALNYGVLAFDTCWSGNPASPNTSSLGDTHNTIYLESALSICEREVNLTWNEYVSRSVDHYEIYGRIGATPEFLVGTVPNGTTSYTHLNALPFVTYTYYVKVVFASGAEVSFSNKRNVFIYQPPSPMYTYLQVASVADENEVDLRLTTDLAASVSYYAFERSVEFNGPWEEIGAVTPGGTNPISFTDMTAETSLRSYFYRVAVIDSCGDTSMVSNNARTILINAYAQSDSLVNIVNWSAYGIWDGGVTEYRLYRSIDGVFDPSPIAVLPPNLRAYQDNVAGLIQQVRGEFCYYVEAVEGNNTYGFAEASFSNVACAYQEPKFWVPNAINVGGGFNEVFMPVAGYIDYDSYEMYIYTRWGQKIFHTTEILQGWDGTFKGKPVEPGVFVYHFIFKGADGQDIEHRGPVTVIYTKQ